VSQTYIPAALRRQVRERANDRCEYCLIPESIGFVAHCIDHVIAEKHGGQTDADNLANSCILCNQHKGSDLSSLDPETGEVALLFNPRREKWSEHFRLNGAIIEPLSPSGRVTIRLLRLNTADRVRERERMLEVGYQDRET